jgi:hypothetical protein
MGMESPEELLLASEEVLPSSYVDYRLTRIIIPSIIITRALYEISSPKDVGSSRNPFEVAVAALPFRRQPEYSLPFSSLFARKTERLGLPILVCNIKTR